MRTRLAAGALAVVGLLAAGCSSGPNGGTGYPATPAAANPVGAGAGGTGQNTKSLYISCLASHGVPVSARGVTLSRNSPRLLRAEQACRSLRPRGAQAGLITTQDQVYYLKAAQCMRAHGVPQFPDPVFANGGVHFPVPRGVDTHSLQVLRAIATCRRLIPQGLPYSR